VASVSQIRQWITENEQLLDGIAVRRLCTRLGSVEFRP
jgi:hypothetical protein